MSNGKQIARAREELGLNDNELGEKLGLSGATLYYYEIGLLDPGEHLEDIARVTGKPIAWFLDPPDEDDLIGALRPGNPARSRAS